MKNTIERAALRAKTPFKNAALIDFTKEENRQAQMQALEQVKSELGRTYPLIIGGQKITNKDTFASVNPSQPDQVIGYFSRATVEQATRRYRRPQLLLKAGSVFRRKNAPGISSQQLTCCASAALNLTPG